jgi:hypothetical protein
MNTLLQAKLEKKIQEWADDNCESDAWPDGYTGADTVILMAEAACAVFDAAMKVQEYTIREGFLAKT